MSDSTKLLLTVLVAVMLALTTIVLANFLLGNFVPAYWAALGAVLFGIGYGLQAGILGIYQLSGCKGWVELVVDCERFFWLDLLRNGLRTLGLCIRQPLTRISRN